tara:strand:- start:194 stop:832 length:639 start_codon:yes stop_codon:yes gene_type:complete
MKVKDFYGLTPDKFPKIEKFKIKKFVDKSRLSDSFNGKEGYRFGLKKMLIHENRLENFQRILFSLARQIPANWSNSQVLLPSDHFVFNYIYYFIQQSYELQNVLNEFNETYEFAVREILEPLFKLYKTKQDYDDWILDMISQHELKTKIQKDGQSCGYSDADLAYELSAYHIMYAPSDLRRSLTYVPGYVQCEKLRKYISKNYKRLEREVRG